MAFDLWHYPSAARPDSEKMIHTRSFKPFVDVMPFLRGYARTLVALLLLGALFAMSACSSRDRAPESTFLLLDGSKATTADLKGKVTLVNFWATTCVSCVKEMPALVSTFEKYRDQGYETVAVAMSYDEPSWVVNFAKTRQLPFKVALDNTGEIARSWGEVKLTPTTYLVDKQGYIVKRFVGEPDMAALHNLIEDLLRKG